jgi:hypothetical protein
MKTKTTREEDTKKISQALEKEGQFDDGQLREIIYELTVHLREQLMSLPTSSYPPGIIAWRLLERLGLLSEEESQLLTECGKTVPLETTLDNWEDIWKKKGLIQTFRIELEESPK